MVPSGVNYSARLTQARDCCFFILAVVGLLLVEAAKAEEKASWRKDDVPWRAVAEYATHFALISSGSLASDGSELVAERSQAGISDFHADVRH
jgi:hypothetical protein